MSLVGRWRNQFGSIVEITKDSDHRIEGTFSTALDDSGFYGQEVRILGIHRGDCISFAAGGNSPGRRRPGYLRRAAARRPNGNALVRHRGCGSHHIPDWLTGRGEEVELVASSHDKRRYV
jgi:hypothetical protein